MAKTQIYQQEEALSVYFRDMLAEPQPPEAKVEQKSPPAHSDSIEATPLQHDVAENRADKAVHKLLLCEIGGMKLAVDLDALNNIVHWPAAGLNQLPGRHRWQLGLLRDRQQHAEVIDIRPLLQTAADNDFKTGYILLVNERRFGIACDRISQIIQLDNEQINWRRDRAQRPWFSGVIADSMHSIIDLPRLLAALNNGEMA